MNWTLIGVASIVYAVTFGGGTGVIPGPQAPAPAPAVAAADESRRPAMAAIVAKIRRADYEGDRAALAKLRDELTPFVDRPGAPAAQTSRALYWRGFALWRRALNGFNDAAPRSELDADLRQATADFRTAFAQDPTLVDAQAGAASCLVNTAVLHMKTPEALELLQQSWQLVAATLAAAPENPRVLWVHGANQWYAPVERGGGQQAATDTYARGLKLVREQKGRVTDPLEPTWGEPELLMNLAFANLRREKPDLAAAERYAREALALVPYWHYVRDILMKEIKTTPGLVSR